MGEVNLDGCFGQRVTGKIVAIATHYEVKASSSFKGVVADPTEKHVNLMTAIQVIITAVATQQIRP